MQGEASTEFWPDQGTAEVMIFTEESDVPFIIIDGVTTIEDARRAFLAEWTRLGATLAESMTTGTLPPA
jgi:hypothetical protein